MTENVIVSRLAGQVAQLAINRPEAKNAIDETTRLALIDAIGDVLSDQSVRALLLCGNQGVFCAGGDLASMRGMDESQARQRMQSGHKLVNLLWNADIPVVIALEKFAIGAGAGLALLGDYIVAGESARVSFPFMQLGLIPDWGSTQSLIRRAGHSQTRRLILDKASLKGEQLLALNIADQIVPDSQVLETALAKATKLANYPQLAFQQFKQTMRAFPQPFEDALATEREQQTACFLSAEFEEGLTAMQEKRSPDFVKAAD